MLVEGYVRIYYEMYLESSIWISRAPKWKKKLGHDVSLVPLDMPKSKFSMSFDAVDPSAFNSDMVAEHFQATPPMDIAPPKSSEPYIDDSPSEEHAGRLPEEVYANTFPWWRAALRRKCVAVVEWESEVIAKWQVRPSPPFFAGPNDVGGERAHCSSLSHFTQARFRSPWLDTYFLQTSMLGTHTFFLVFLPVFFFFGYDELGTG